MNTKISTVMERRIIEDFAKEISFKRSLVANLKIW